MGSCCYRFLEACKDQKTTFDEDFDIAEAFGIGAIKGTYEEVKRQWSSNYEYFTELVLVLNWKCWDHYYAGNHDYGRLYHDLYYKARDYALTHFKGEALTYFLRETD